MAESATLARPYAKAAFMAARDSASLPAWSTALEAGSGLVADARIADLISSPKLGSDDVVSLFAGLGGRGIEPQWQNFIRLLSENKRLDVLADITAQYTALRARFENELDVQVTSAIALDEPQRAKLAAALKTRFKRDVRLSTAIDPALLGGAVIRAGDLVIDGSISGRLQRMSAELGS